MCSDRAERCNIVRHTAELLTDEPAAQSKPPLCDNQADNQSTVTWPGKCNECVQCLPVAPTIISTVAARGENDARSAPSEHCQNKRALRMGWRCIANLTCYRYFARAKRKKTQQDWAVITLEVDAVLGRVQIAVHWLTSFVCDKGQVQCLMTPFIMRNS